MLISDLIAELEHHRRRYGDVEVVFFHSATVQPHSDTHPAMDYQQVRSRGPWWYPPPYAVDDGAALKYALVIGCRHG